MKLSVFTNSYHEEEARVWLLDNNDLTMAEKPRLLYRGKTDPSLLVFYVLDDRWLRVTPQSKKPRWIDMNDLDQPLRESFVDRSQVFADASAIFIESPHRIRSAPTTDSETLASIVSSVGDVTPLEVRDYH